MTSEDAEGSLRGLREGFDAYYRPTTGRLKAAYDHGIIVLDTNVLLDLYRFTPKARSSLLDVIHAARDRIFVPHHVALEFHRNRATAVGDRRNELSSARSRLLSLQQQATGEIRKIAYRVYGQSFKIEAIEGALDEAFSRAIGLIEQASTGHDLTEAGVASGHTDSVLDRLEPILEGRVGQRPTESTLEADRVEAERRAALKIPPGFKDASKLENGDGDYLWWAEVIRKVQGTGVPVLIVSNDLTKGDWVYETRGVRVGPDPLLLEEVVKGGGSDLIVQTTGEFIASASDLLDVPVAAGTLKEATALPRADMPSADIGYVPFHAVPRVVDLSRTDLDQLIDRNFLPRNPGYWPWREVRRAAILALVAGKTDKYAVLRAVSDATRPYYNAARSALIVGNNTAYWVAPQEVEDYLRFHGKLGQEILMVLDVKDYEEPLRSRYAQYFPDGSTTTAITSQESDGNLPGTAP